MKTLKKLSDLKSLSLKALCLIMILITGFVTTNCSNDDGDEPAPHVYTEENPLEKFYTDAGFTETFNYIDLSNYEFGLVFSPNVKGKINAITVKLPDANPALKVTIWDYTTKTVLKTELLNVTVSNTLTTKIISEMVLEKDKKYVITMNSNDWYNRKRKDGQNAAYPITAGNIKFWEYRWIDGTAQVFPTKIELGYNGGDLSFNFQQID